MLHILTDSSSALSAKEAEDLKVKILPLHVQLNGISKLDVFEIQPDEVLNFCLQGGYATTSQPSIGEKMDAYEAILKDPDAQILDICMADGLSGTYASALMAKEQSDAPERIHVFNSKTINGPQRGMVLKACKMRDEGKSLEEIVKVLEQMTEEEVSLLAVDDFRHLSKTGRVSSIIGNAGAFMKLVPVVMKNKEGTKLDLYKTVRTMRKAVKVMAEGLKEQNAKGEWTFYISHAGNPIAADLAKETIKSLFADAKVEIFDLCSAFVAHGGPGCVAMQAVNENIA